GRWRGDLHRVGWSRGTRPNMAGGARPEARNGLQSARWASLRSAPTYQGISIAPEAASTQKPSNPHAPCKTGAPPGWEPQAGHNHRPGGGLHRKATQPARAV